MNRIIDKQRRNETASEHRINFSETDIAFPADIATNFQGWLLLWRVLVAVVVACFFLNFLSAILFVPVWGAEGKRGKNNGGSQTARTVLLLGLFS